MRQETDDDDDDEAQPFADLFSRLKPVCQGQQQGKKASATPKAKVKAASKAASSARNKRNGGTTSTAGQTDPDLKKQRVARELHGDDLEVTRKFEDQLEVCRCLDVTSTDEVEFARWSKEKIAALTETRSQIYEKKKSLKRRKDTPDDLGETLEMFMAEISQITELVKKLASGTSEGRHLYELLASMSDVTASQAVWMRTIRAIAFENLKLLQWSEFYGKTHKMCKKHGDDDAAFFSLLASQLLQRLVKAVPVSKGITAETTANLNAFVTVMTEPGNVEKTLQKEMDATHHSSVLADLRLVLDFSSPPTLVEKALQNISAETSHWASMAFALPQGKKILDAILVNAKNKEAVSDILATLSRTEDLLKKSGLFSVDCVFSVALSRCFTPDHAVMVSNCLRDLAPKATKGLKGSDREKLGRVQKLAKSCVFCIFYNHVVNELVPYLHDLAVHISSKEPFEARLMSESSCILRLTDGCGHGEEALVDKLKDFSEFTHTLAARLCDTGELNEETASSLTAAWETKSKATIAAIAAFVDRSESSGDDPQKQKKEVLDELKDQAAEVGKSMESALQGHLREGSMANVKECIQVLVQAARCPGTLLEEHVSMDFYKKVEMTQLVSTILGDEGKIVNTGAETACNLFSCLEAYSFSLNPSDTAATATQRSLDFVKTYVKTVSDNANFAESLTALNSVVEVLTKEDQDSVTAALKVLSDAHGAAINKFMGDCKAELDAHFIQPAEVEIPEQFMTIDCRDMINDELVKSSFDMKVTGAVSTTAMKLEEAITFAKDIAVSCGMNVEDLVNIAVYEGSYGAALRWLITGNLLYSLTSKAVKRAVLTSTRPQAKALQALNDAMKVATEHKVEIPPGLQAVVTRIVQPDAVDVQPEAVP